MEDKQLGRRLKASRIEAGFERPADIAPRIGRTPRQVQNYESGTVPPADVLQRWAEATGKPLDYFLPTPTPQDLTAAAAQLPQQQHPGVEALAADSQMRRRWRVTDAEIDELRDMVLRVPLDTPEVAIMALQLLRTQRELEQPPDDA